MNSKLIVIILIGLFYVCPTFGQQDSDISPLNTRIGLGAMISAEYGLNYELTIEKDISRRVYASARFSSLFTYNYDLRLGLHYRLIQYKASYLSIGTAFLFSRAKTRLNAPNFTGRRDWEFPVSVHVSMSKKLMLEAGMATSVGTIHSNYNANKWLALLRLGLKYNLY